MRSASEGLALRVYLGNGDRHEGRLVHELLLEEAARRGLNGGTVLRGISGFGASHRIHAESQGPGHAEDLPVVIEIVDREDRIQGFLPFVDSVVEEGLVSLTRVSVIRYERGR
ncbi:MAG: DUF190 domain-containing protein [Planctomycetes bacterium]|nr:DUF190 domain-containing protein [Planctomycetota bacterium]